MGGFGTIFNNKKRENQGINTTQQNQNEQNNIHNGFLDNVEIINGPIKKVEVNKDDLGDWVIEEGEKKVEENKVEENKDDLGDWVVEEVEKVEEVKQEVKKPMDPAMVYENNKDARNEFFEYQMEKRAKAALAYEEKVVDMKDAAKMSEKKTIFGKAYSEKTRWKNAAIDRSKIMTNKATSLTYSAHKIVNNINQQYDLNILEKKQEELRKENQERDLKEELKAKALQEIMGARGTLLEEKAFERSMLKEHFYEYYSLVKSFEFIDANKNADEEENRLSEMFQETLEELRPFIVLLKKRLTVFTEQNRVRLDGTILGEEDKPAVMRQKDLDEWRELFLPTNKKDPIWDEERLKRRKKKEEIGLQQAIPHGKYEKISKEDAMKTASDLKSQKKRDELRDLNLKLYDLGQKKLAKIINEYVVGTRYAVGYTEERERLKAAMKAVDEAVDHAEKTKLKGEVPEVLASIQNYFKEMTNGTLVIPQNAKVLNYTDDSQMKNQGDNDGYIRNAFIWADTYWSKQKNTPLFSHEPVVNDLKQRMVSNCFMMAATTGIVNIDPAIIKGCMKDMGDGTVVVRLYDVIKAEQEGEGVKPKPIYIRVKKTIPRLVTGKADALSAGTLWMQMLEKAFAFYGRMINGHHVTGYRSLWYGNGARFVKNLLGVDYSSCDIHGWKGKETDKEAKEAFFNDLLNIESDKKVYSTGSKGVDQGKGIQSGHAYTILGGVEINGVKYVKMRNPYSNHSLQYNEKGKRSMTGSSVITFANGSDETYGQFLMKLDDFYVDFPFVYISDLSKLDQQNQENHQ